MKNRVFRFSFLLALVLGGIFATSCATSKKFTYLMNMQLDSAYVATKAPETRFQIDDRLAVRPARLRGERRHGGVADDAVGNKGRDHRFCS